MVNVSATRRLTDHQRLRDLERLNPEHFKILEAIGNPPHRYLVRLNCRSIASMSGGKPRYRSSHDLEIILPGAYPIQWPSVEVKTGIWHPHVFSGGAVCLGGHAWNPAEFLDVFVLRLWSILTWDPLVINVHSPANYEAMNWYRGHQRDLPLDKGTLRTGEAPKPPITWKAT
jgi:ubiquitin-protein ligase